MKDPTRCIASIYSDYHSRQCSRPRGHGRDGLYCKQHDPENIAKRDAAQRKKYDEGWIKKRAMWDKERREHEAYEPMLAALKAVLPMVSHTNDIAVQIRAAIAKAEPEEKI